VDIKTEADSNDTTERPLDDRNTGMFGISDCAKNGLLRLR